MSRKRASKLAWPDLVHTALAESATSLGTTANGGWSFQLANGAPHEVSAKLADGWLFLDAELGGSIGIERLWPMLVANTALTGFSKFVLAPDRQPKLRVELPLAEDAALARRTREACDGLRMGLETFWKKDAPPFSGDKAQGGSCDLKHLCEVSGWPFVERGPGRVTVPLEAAHGEHQALLVALGEGLHLTVDLGVWESVPEVSRPAIAVLLLTASGLVRMARACAVERDGGGAEARLEVVFSTVPAASELSAALCSLSVGCNDCPCAQEARALQEEAVAREYLAVRGWTSGSA